MFELSDQEFSHFQRFIYQAAGISLVPTKKSLVVSRLGRRAADKGCRSFSDYFRLLSSGESPGEVQTAIDLLTTNETYFFREPKHFEVLRKHATAPRADAEPFRVWSAAASTGEEAYSIAMVLDDCLAGRPWSVLGSDISSRVLAKARNGVFSTARTSLIPAPFLKRYCLRGMGPAEGTMMVMRGLRSRVEFVQVNLNASIPPRVGRFDVIFLRNVLIYFNQETKKEVIKRVLGTLKPGGFFFIGHSESLNGLNEEVTLKAPSIYRKE